MPFKRTTYSLEIPVAWTRPGFLFCPADLITLYSTCSSALWYLACEQMESVTRVKCSFLVSIWVENASDGLPIWRGVLVTLAGQRLPFTSLAQLERWLCELGGWQDPPQTADPTSVVTPS